MHLLLDIEALALKPGAAIIEIAAGVFDPNTGEVRGTFHRYTNSPIGFLIDAATMDWHIEQGTFRRRKEAAAEIWHLDYALTELCAWIKAQNHVQPITAFWAWGSDYDFPLLQYAFDKFQIAAPWQYWEKRCARTVYKVAFGDESKPAKRTHAALEDVRAAIGDLCAAIAHMKGVGFRGEAGNLVHPVMRCAHCRQPFTFGQDRIKTDDGLMHEDCVNEAIAAAHAQYWADEAAKHPDNPFIQGHAEAVNAGGGQ